MTINASRYRLIIAALGRPPRVSPCESLLARGAARRRDDVDNAVVCGEKERTEGSLRIRLGVNSITAMMLRVAGEPLVMVSMRHVPATAARPRPTQQPESRAMCKREVHFVCAICASSTSCPTHPKQLCVAAMCASRSRNSVRHNLLIKPQSLYPIWVSLQLRSRGRSNVG